MPTAIECDQLTKSYGATTAVRSVSFQVHPGEIVGLVGRNGAGKTTTLKAILGLTEPTGGRALVVGRRYVELEHPTRTVGALVGSGFHPSRTGDNHLKIRATEAALDPACISRALELVGLPDKDASRRVGEYSLGMRQRLALAAALLGAPPVLVLDEPANGLDPYGIRWLRGFLRQLADEGTAVLLSSHDLYGLGSVVDGVVVIEQGSVLAAGSASEVCGGHPDLETAYFELIEAGGR